MTKHKQLEAMLGAYVCLSGGGEDELTAALKKKIMQQIRFIAKKDWQDLSICAIFPEVDIRCLAYCCPEQGKHCVMRNLVLEVSGLQQHYTPMKMIFGEEIAELFMKTRKEKDG